ncbi:MAG: alpha-hydroxy-acid oxidizing protein [Actinomycetales bacterium]|nr:alpha-hydroxy-acid oxidizing protein [Actinomycetales bacterium]
MAQHDTVGSDDLGPDDVDLDHFVDVDDFQRAAEARMPEPYRDFVNNVGMEETLRGDLAAWAELRLRPRALVDVSHVDTSVTVLGTELSAPIITAPFIGSALVDDDAEVATARGATAAGTVSTLSMMGTRGPEAVGPAAGGRYWQQLYWMRDRSIVQDVVERAVAAGASALCLTVDLPVRPAFPSRMRAADRAMRGLWEGPEQAFYVIHDYREKPEEGKRSDTSVTWRDLEWLSGLSELPLILKGIIRPEDAVLAREHGASAVIVSNHAGQGLRFSMPVAHALPEIVEAVGGEIEVLADSGIRTGSDVARALALGARAVLIGRPTLWGLTVGGAAGVERVIRILSDELAEVMALTGAPRLADIDGAILAPPRGDR